MLLLAFLGFLLQFFQLLALSLYFLLVLFDLLIEAVLPFLQTLNLIANQRARAQAKPGADGSSGRRMTDRAADNPADSGASDSTDGRSLFTGRERL